MRPLALYKRSQVHAGDARPSATSKSSSRSFSLSGTMRMLSGTSEEVHEYPRTQVGFLEAPQDEKVLLCLLDQGVGVEGPGKIIRYADANEFEARYTTSPLIWMKMCVMLLARLKSTIIV